MRQALAAFHPGESDFYKYSEMLHSMQIAHPAKECYTMHDNGTDSDTYVGITTLHFSWILKQL